MHGVVRRAHRLLHRIGVDVSRYPGATAPAVHLKDLLDALRIDCVLDVGAHRGEYARMLRRIGYEGRIVSFEPNPEEYRLLERATGGDAAWDARELALGGTAGPRTLNVAAATELSSFLDASTVGTQHHGAGIATAATVTVAMAALEDVLGELTSRRVFLKTDAQGLDLDVIRGAGKRLGDLLAVESEVAVTPSYRDAPDLVEMLQFMDANGFGLTGVFPGVSDRATRELLEVECFWRNRRP
jgi:FkbM family methyltransferase